MFNIFNSFKVFVMVLVAAIMLLGLTISNGYASCYSYRYRSYYRPYYSYRYYEPPVREVVYLNSPCSAPAAPVYYAPPAPVYTPAPVYYTPPAAYTAPPSYQYQYNASFTTGQQPAPVYYAPPAPVQAAPPTPVYTPAPVVTPPAPVVTPAPTVTTPQAYYVPQQIVNPVALNTVANPVYSVNYVDPVRLNVVANHHHITPNGIALNVNAGANQVDVNTRSRVGFFGRDVTNIRVSKR